MQLRAKLLFIVHVSRLMHNLISELYNVLARTDLMTPAMHQTHHQRSSNPLLASTSQVPFLLMLFYKTFLNHYFSFVSFNPAYFVKPNDKKKPEHSKVVHHFQSLKYFGSSRASNYSLRYLMHYAFEHDTIRRLACVFVWTRMFCMDYIYSESHRQTSD